MRLSLRSLRLLPLVAGTAWSITLLALLIYWLAEGRPRYPFQSNPYVAYISDIGAFRLKPVFIVGALLTSTTLLGTIITVHLAFHQHRNRHRGLFTEHRWKYTKVSSIIACIFAFASCPCQICLPIFDNHRKHQIHQVLLSLALLGTGVTALCTTITFWGEMWPPRKEESPHEAKTETPLGTRRRRSIMASNTLFMIEIVLGTCFIAFLWTGSYRVAGILEWVMSFLFTGYFWAFVGFWIPSDDPAAAEERPLRR
ncbi:MAG: hypothetical protein HETSPECPRED_010271 [Heterodermia speciosa]|uniref:CWH43-like N-terminal domain-containing protein n=1 Tax=Heterodermia speciosa TaxID=116794 RepID=A0A8H3IZB5_9LECA|nr:MAG: hypothetical protein HETSPECPRED_010271 [Heterodermia speciosa]